MDYLPKVTHGDVLRILERDWRPEERDEVLRLLHQYDTDGSEDAAARVRLAILKLSEGRLADVPLHLETANTDYRDVLVAAEYPEFGRAASVGIDRMTPEAVENLKARDWDQYEAWLKRV